MNNIRPLQLAVLQIFDLVLGNTMFGRENRAEIGDWSVQGFGFMRLYIRKIGRLHIWNSALRYPDVSIIHNHSWDLRSTVVSGCLVNTRYEPNDVAGDLFLGRKLVTGYHSHFTDNEEYITRLLPLPRERYWPGDIYKQSAHEIHCTDARDGSITLMERHEDVDGEATVYWPYGTTWGDAKPRKASTIEIRQSINLAIQVLGTI